MVNHGQLFPQGKCEIAHDRGEIQESVCGSRMSSGWREAPTNFMEHCKEHDIGKKIESLHILVDIV